MEPLNGAVFLSRMKTKVFDKAFVCGVRTDSHRHAALFSSPFFLLLAGGKDGEMKKLIDFEYDLWTTEDGRCMVRVRLTREECEVDRETFRLLRAEEKRLRRELSLPADVDDLSPQAAVAQSIKHPLPLDVVDIDKDSERTSWYFDPHDIETGMVSALAEKAFLDTLTPRQAEVYQYCISGRYKKSEYAKLRGLSPSRVSRTLQQIRVAAKNFFAGC